MLKCCTGVVVVLRICLVIERALQFVASTFSRFTHSTQGRCPLGADTSRICRDGAAATIRARASETAARGKWLVCTLLAMAAGGLAVEEGAAQDPAPTVAEVRIMTQPYSGDTYAVGELIRISVKFNEPVTVTGTPTLTLTIGSQQREVELTFSSGSSGTLFFNYLVQTEDLDRDGIGIAADALSLNDATIRDSANNDAEPGLGTHAISNAGAHKVDGSLDHPPQVSDAYISSAPRSGDTYAVGEGIEVAVAFSEPVTIAGSPQLTVTVGAATRTAHLRSWGSTALWFRYEVQANDVDRDGISVAADALSLNGGAIRDSASNDAELGLGAHAIVNAADHKVDGSLDNAPIVQRMYFLGGPHVGDTYAVGEVITVEIEFSEAVTVTGAPELTLAVGSAMRTAQFARAWRRWVSFEYVVQANDVDRDGISIAADALSLNGGTVRDSGGNDADLDLGAHAVVNSANAKVDAGVDHVATVFNVFFSSFPERGDTYAVNEVIEIGVGFSETITVTGTPQLELTIGTATRAAEFTDLWDSGTGFSLQYKVQSDDLDRDGISIAADALKLNGASIEDSTDNDADLDLGEHAISNASAHKVDGSIDYTPMVEDVVFWTRPQIGDTYAVGELIEISIDFTERVTVTGTPLLMLTIGSQTRNVEMRFASHGRGSLFFWYEVQTEDLDGDGIGIAADALSLNGATIRDSGGNDAELDLGPYAISNAADHKVDGSVDRTATVSEAFLIAPERGDTYTLGEVIEVGVRFGETISVTGTPQLTLTIGNDARSAELLWVWDSRLGLSFQYEVQAGDLDRDGISIAAGALSLNGGSIQDSTGNDAELDLGDHAIVNDADHKVDGSIDYAPTVSDVYIWSEPRNGEAYAVGEVIGVGIVFSEAITLTGTPQLTLTIGDAARRAEFINWSSGRGIVWFEYEVHADDLDRDGVSIAADALSLNEATIEDGAGNDADLDLGEHAISNDGDHRVDGSVDYAPVVREVEFDSHPERGDTYAAGEVIDIEIEFNEIITVTGSPELTLTIGNATRPAQFAWVWRRWVSFEYEVQADDLDRDGVSIAAEALSLNGGSIQDNTGNDAELDLGDHAIVNAADHKVDGSVDHAPTVSDVFFLSEPRNGEAYGAGELIGVGIDFTEPITVTGTPLLTLTVGSLPRTAAFTGFASFGRIWFEYAVQAEDLDQDGVSIAADALSLNGSTIEDRTGNDAEPGLGEHAILNAADHKVDGSIDHVATVSDVFFWSRPHKGETYAVGELIGVGVTFTETIAVTGTPQLELTIGSATRSAEFSHVWSTRRGFSLRYEVQAEDLDADGISIAADALHLNGATIKDSTDNDVELGLGEHAISNDGHHKVDGSIDHVPEVSGAGVSSEPRSGDTYARDEVIEVVMVFTERIAVTGTPQFTLTIGSATRSAEFTRVADSQRAVYFEYVVQADDLDRDGIGAAADALNLNGATIQDLTGNDADPDLGEHAFSNAGYHKVDGSIDLATAVVEVRIQTYPQTDDAYLRDELIRILVEFDERVIVTGSPQLTLLVGSEERTLDLYHQRGGGLEFLYQVQETDRDADGISVPADALSLNGATIRNEAGEDADPDLGRHAISNAEDHQVDGSRRDAVAPSVRRAEIESEPPHGDTYGLGETIEVRVSFDEQVTVTGTPTLVLAIGDATRTLDLDGVRPPTLPNHLFFRYEVTAEDLDADGISLAPDALQLNGASIQDSAGNDAELDLGEHAIVNAGDHKVDGTPQVVELGCKQPDASGARVVAGRSQGVLAPGEELVLELEENRAGGDTAVMLGCVALEGEYRYSVSAGNEHGAFLIGATDGMLSYVGGGEDAEATAQLRLTVAAAPQGGGETVAVGVRIAIVNADDPGLVTLSTTTPERGAMLTAQLEDQDAGVLVQRWQWRRKAADADWTAIEGATEASYTPVAADVGSYLQAEVAYTDEHGAQQARSELTAPVNLAAARRARMLQLGLTGFGRSVASGAVSALGERFAAAASSSGDGDRMDLKVTLNRRPLHLPDAGDVAAQGALLRGVTAALGVRVTAAGEIDFDPVSGAQLLAESAFSMEHGSGGRWGAWGSGDVSGFAGEVDGFEQEATVISGYLGVDYRFVPNGLAGLAASYSSLDLTSESELEGEATLTGHLVSAYPYGFWMPEPWLGLWGVAGLGTGRAELEDLGVTREGDLRMWLGAMGQRVELVSAGGLSLAAKSDGFITGLTSGGELPRVDAGAWRVRLLLEGGLEWRPGDSRLGASVELGGRLDGGDAERGLGAEGGAALSYTHVGSGLGITGRGRLLLVHEDAAIRDWGASAILSWAPPGPGPAVSLAPVWGEPTSGVSALWQNREVLAGGSAGASSGERAAWLPDAVDLRVSYGLGLLYGRVTPFATIQFEDATARRLRIGAAVETSDAAVATRLQLEAFGERAANGDAATYQFGVGGTVQY